MALGNRIFVASIGVLTGIVIGYNMYAPQSLDSKDVNKDNKTDIIVKSYWGSEFKFYNQGNGVYMSKYQIKEKRLNKLELELEVLEGLKTINKK